MDSFWPTLFGSMIGVVAGTFIQYFVEVFLEWRSRTKTATNLTKEFKYNLAIMEGCKNGISRAQVYCGSGQPWSARPNINFGTALHLILSRIISSGEIYDLFDNKEISRIAFMRFYLSTENYNWFFNQYEQLKQTSDVKGFLEILDGLEQQAIEVEKTLKEMIQKISSLPVH